MPMGIWCGGSRVLTIVCAVGIMAPPANPWPMRPMIICGRLCEKPHMTEKIVKRIVLFNRKARRPNTRVSHAVSGIITISDMR
jgi:hypothetical protein